MQADTRVQLDERLKELAEDAQRHSYGTKERRLALTHLVNAIWQSGRLCHPNRGQFPPVYDDIYDDAVQNLFFYICQNDNIRKYDSERASVIAWVNMLLSRRFFPEAIPKIIGKENEINSDVLAISQLQSLERFHEYLEELSQVGLAELASPSITSGSILVNLEQWFENIFEAGWQEIETLLGTQVTNLALSLRSTQEVRLWRGKLIDFGIKNPSQSVVLVVALAPQNEGEMDIWVEVHPYKGQTYLPPNLQLMLLDDLGEAVMEAQARSANSYIQLQFGGSPGEHFSVRVNLGDITVIENFVI